LLLSELRLPGVKAIWPKLAAVADKEGVRAVVKLTHAPFEI
jgi:hypothetical protein